ncbi:DUF4982 domain-containing protein [Metabacillus litoralis]|uniref:DUF4982 domain-containing protein n=1 Tax=Metabacillus litoralis TaxID=152268 RepID=UPI001CFD06B4|nr:DUF4982 domain-containing protein [Metabacillus litoralis]
MTSKRFSEREDSITPVKVYSNLEEVTLTVNGIDYGKGTVQQPGLFIWESVELKESGNEVIATAEKEDGTNATDTVTTWEVTE